MRHASRAAPAGAARMPRKPNHAFRDRRNLRRNLTPRCSAARDGAVVCDLVPCAVLAIDGPDAAAFLQGQLSNDVDATRRRRLPAREPQLAQGPDAGQFRVVARARRPRIFARCCPPSSPRRSPSGCRCTCCAPRSSCPTPPGLARLGVGGPGGGEALRARLGDAPHGPSRCARRRVDALGLPGPRYGVIAPPAALEATRAELLRTRAGRRLRRVAMADDPRRRARRDRRDAGPFVAQAANWTCWAAWISEGCYTGQEIIARMQYLGRLKERLFAFHAGSTSVAAGARLYSSAFAGQPCGTVVNAAPAPDGGLDLTAVLQIAAADPATCRSGRPTARCSRCVAAASAPAAPAAGAPTALAPDADVPRARRARRASRAIRSSSPPIATSIMRARAAPAAWWDEGWLGGRDLTAGGTWLGVTRSGRCAFVTNVREPGRNDPARLRAERSSRAAQPHAPPVATFARVVDAAHAYNGFNLIAGEVASACWGSNRVDAARRARRRRSTASPTRRSTRRGRK